MGVRREVQRILAQFRKLRLRRQIGERWSESDGFSARVYPDYATYVTHQGTKLQAMRASTLEHHDERFYTALCERITALGLTLLAKPVLCLAARQGTEVRVFRDHGAFAVGIDLEPGRANEYVTRGDFHALRFSNNAVAIVFTNSMDHAFDPDRMMGEVRRVLAADGLFIVEVGSGTTTDLGKGAYESFAWKTVEDLLPRLLAHGFTVQHRSSFSVPWSGEQLVLRKSDERRATSDENFSEGHASG